MSYKCRHELEAEKEQAKEKGLAPDWSNRNTITGEVIFEAHRIRKGTHSEPDCEYDRLISSPMGF